MTKTLPATSMSLDGKQITMLVVSVICIFLTVLGAGLRTYGRLIVLRKLFVEDVFTLFAAVVALALSAVCIAGASYGLGKHDDDLQGSRHLGIVRQMPVIATYFWVGSASLVKVSVLFFYHRMDQRKPMRWTVYFLMFVVIAQSIVLIFIFSSYCFPTSARWPGSSAFEGGRWNNSTIQWYLNGNGVGMAVIDAAIFVAPLFMLHRLAIPKNRKYLVGAQFTLAALPILAGCLRCYFTWHIVSSPDPSYDLVNPIVCAQAEVHLAMLCTSSSSFNVLLKAWGLFPCNRPSTSIGSLPTMPASWPMNDKVEQARWQDWRLPTSELSADMVMAVAHHHNFGSKESVINANSPRDAPRIVFDKRRYTDVSSVPAHSRNAGPEFSALSKEKYIQSSVPSSFRDIYTPEREMTRQHHDAKRSLRSPPLAAARSSVVREGHSLHFFIDKGYEGDSAVSARAIVRFPSINERISHSTWRTEREGSQRRLTLTLTDEWHAR